MKMLNLCHEWLAQLMPHILQKIDRVSYGLLSEAEIAKAERRGANVPRSRKLCAVPYVGKDVPSTASEFSHPDIVIGLTVTAYRYEGMREGDFRTALGALKASMGQESGKYSERPSCLRYARWAGFPNP